MKALAALLLIAAPAFASGPVKWEHDYQSALKRAKAEKKVVFMDLRWSRSGTAPPSRRAPSSPRRSS